MPGKLEQVLPSRLRRHVSTLQAATVPVPPLPRGLQEPPSLIGDDSSLLRSRADTLEYLAFRLLRLGCGFEVHEPAELREHLRDLAPG